MKKLIFEKAPTQEEIDKWLAQERKTFFFLRRVVLSLLVCIFLVNCWSLIANWRSEDSINSVIYAVISVICFLFFFFRKFSYALEPIGDNSTQGRKVCLYGKERNKEHTVQELKILSKGMRLPMEK